MNNVSCEIIQDLLPLYSDGVCSEESGNLIQTHVQTCEKCGKALQAMKRPLRGEETRETVETAQAASRAWKKNRKRAFWTGLSLVAALVIAGVLLFLGAHYLPTSDGADMEGLTGQLKQMWELEQFQVKKVAQKGDCLAVSGCDDGGSWYMCVYQRDPVFSNRWQVSGGLGKVKPGKLANWNYQTPEGDTILVCYGAELPEEVVGYTFTNSGIQYRCPVEDHAVLDLFFIPEAYDPNTHLEPVSWP